MFETEILEINEKSLEKARKYISEGLPVAFPTETVYGLGASAFNDDAIKKIFEAKGRPSDNPLIVHVDESYDVDKLVEVTYDYAYKLREAFTPGPLTMVYKSKGAVSKIATCGLDTVGIRIPGSEDARKFLKAVGAPIAAPSANISKHTSPVTARHVYDDMKGRIPLILDGGKCVGGIESTVLDVTTDTPTILRSGLVTAEMIKRVVGKCAYSTNKETDKVRAPGMKYTHYTPKCETALFKRDEIERAKNLYENYEKEGKIPYFMCDSEIEERLPVNANYLRLGKTAEEIASNLYYKLLEGEKVADIIVAFEVDTADEVGIGVMNRLTKACKRI